MHPELNEWLKQQQRTLALKAAGNIIPRTIEAFSSSPDPWLYGSDIKTLQKEVFEHKHIVLLGGAGSGKSLELLKMAVDRSLPERVPIYIKLNQYEEGFFEKCLPGSWQIVNPTDCLLLLDGLDEIKQDFRTKAIERIYEFSQAFPETRIVISCRTNFFNEDEVSAKKQLADFKIYEINDLTLDNVVAYSTEKLKQSGNDFVEQARRKGYFDLLLKPFFLEVLIGYYEQNTSLSKNRKDILEHFVKSNINNDINRYELDDVQGTVQEEVYILLQRCALVMESIGRNFLLQHELKIVLETNLNVRLIRHFSLFTKSSDHNGKWSFQHNIIQEYLAAKAISDCDPDEIKSFVSTSPKQHHIKSYWLNTFSILMSLVNDNTKDALWDWVLSVNPEILVRIEPDRFGEEHRLMILQYILEDLKLKDLWLRSHYFTERELSNFTEGPLAFEYLLREISNGGIPETARMNALQVLRHFTRLTIGQRQRLKTTVLTLLDEFSNVYTIDFIVATLIELDFTNVEVLEKLMMTFKNRQNQFIRTAIYRMIEAAGLADDHVKYILEGIKIISSGTSEDRHSTNLISESILLERLIVTFESGKAIRRVIDFFTTHTTITSFRIFDDITKIFQHLTNKASTLYVQDVTFYTVMANWAKTLTSSLHQNVLQIVLNFFHTTATNSRFFDTAWNDKTMNAYTRMVLISELANDSTFADFREKYERKIISESDVEELLQLISNNAYDDKMQRKKLASKQLYESLTGIPLPEPPGPAEYLPKLKERNQREFDLLFQPEQFSKELKQLFEKLSLTHVSSNDLHLLFTMEKPLDASAVPRPVQHFIREFGSAHKLSWEDSTSLLQNELDFNRFIVQEMHALLTNYATIEVSPVQKNFIEHWCCTELNKFSIKDAQLIYDRNTSGRYFNGINELIWSFYMKFDFELPAEKMITFTIPAEFIENGALAVLIILEELLGREQVLRQVLENIRYKIVDSNILTDSYAYVMNRNLHAVDEYLKRDLLDTTLDIDSRTKLYNLYTDETRDFSLALELIQELSITDPFYNPLIEDARNTDKQLVIQLLNDRLLAPEVSAEDKIATAVALANMDQISGINYLINGFLHDVDTEVGHGSLICLEKARNPLAIPGLIQLFTSVQTPSFERGRSEMLQRISLNGLQQIGSQSEDAFCEVKHVIEKLIETEKNNASLYLVIRNMEYQVFDKQQPNLTIQQSLQDIDSMAPLRDSEIVRKINRRRSAQRAIFKKRQLKRWRTCPLFLGIPLLLLAALYLVIDIDHYLSIALQKGFISNIMHRSLSLFAKSWLLIFPAWLGIYLLRRYQPSQIKAYIEMINYPATMRDITEAELEGTTRP